MKKSKKIATIIRVLMLLLPLTGALWYEHVTNILILNTISGNLLVLSLIAVIALHTGHIAFRNVYGNPAQKELLTFSILSAAVHSVSTLIFVGGLLLAGLGLNVLELSTHLGFAVAFSVFLAHLPLYLSISALYQTKPNISEKQAVSLMLKTMSPVFLGLSILIVLFSVLTGWIARPWVEELAIIVLTQVWASVVIRFLYPPLLLRAYR